MSAAQFLESLFGTLPEFFKDEDQLREIWSEPATRKALLTGLGEKGFRRDALAEMQKAIEAEDSDLFDVLAYVAYTRPPITRGERAVMAKASISTSYKSNRQLAFLESRKAVTAVATQVPRHFRCGCRLGHARADPQRVCRVPEVPLSRSAIGRLYTKHG